MTEGKVVQWLRRIGRFLRAGRRIAGDRDVEDHQRRRGRIRRHVVARCRRGGRTLPIGGLLAVIGPADAPASDIEAFVSGFVLEAPADDATEAADAPAPRMLDVAGTRLRYLELGGGAGSAGAAAPWFRSRSEQLDVQPTGAGRRRPALALDLPGHGGSARDVGAGDAAAMRQAVEAFVTALGLSRADAFRRPFVGRRTGGFTGGAPARSGAVADADCAGRARPRDQRAPSSTASCGRSRRKDAVEVLQLLVHDPALVSRTMVEDVLRFKRLDGVTAALATIAAAWFAGGRQTLYPIAGDLAGLDMPGAAHLGPRRPHHSGSPRECRPGRAPSRMCWMPPAICRTWRRPAK